MKRECSQARPLSLSRRRSGVGRRRGSPLKHGADVVPHILIRERRPGMRAAFRLLPDRLAEEVAKARGAKFLRLRVLEGKAEASRVERRQGPSEQALETGVARDQVAVESRQRVGPCRERPRGDRTARGDLPRPAGRVTWRRGRRPTRRQAVWSLDSDSRVRRRSVASRVTALPRPTTQPTRFALPA